MQKSDAFHHNLTHSLNGHKNDDDDDDDIKKKEGQLWKKHDGLACGMQEAMVLLVIDKVQWWMDEGPTAQLSVWW